MIKAIQQFGNFHRVNDKLAIATMSPHDTVSLFGIAKMPCQTARQHLRFLGVDDGFIEDDGCITAVDSGVAVLFNTAANGHLLSVRTVTELPVHYDLDTIDLSMMLVTKDRIIENMSWFDRLKDQGKSHQHAPCGMFIALPNQVMVTNGGTKGIPLVRFAKAKAA